MRDFNTYLKEIGEVGYVESIIHSVFYVNGLPGAKLHELVLAEEGQIGIVQGILLRDPSQGRFANLPGAGLPRAKGLPHVLDFPVAYIQAHRSITLATLNCPAPLSGALDNANS